MNVSPFAICLSVIGLVVPSIARADEKSACFDAASQAQILRDAHKLLEARAQLRVCSRPVCPSTVQKDCASWLQGVEDGLPTVVVSAKDAAGKDLIEVALSIDGQLAMPRLTGQALPLNPGPHTFHIVAADGGNVEKQVMVREGRKNEGIELVIGSPALVPLKPEQPSPTETSSASPWRTVGWVVGGVGLAGVVVGAVFGALAVSDKSAAHCDATGACQAGPLSDARTAATVSTIGLAAGGGLVVGGLALVVFGPHEAVHEGRGTTAWTLVPSLIGTQGGALSLRGEF